MRDSMRILDTLQERGYEPQDDMPAGGWFDLPCGKATVRVVLANDVAAVYRLDAHMVSEWGPVMFTDGTPFEVIVATLDAAERDARAG